MTSPKELKQIQFMLGVIKNRGWVLDVQEHLIFLKPGPALQRAYGFSAGSSHMTMPAKSYAMSSVEDCFSWVNGFHEAERAWILLPDRRRKAITDRERKRWAKASEEHEKEMRARNGAPS